MKKIMLYIMVLAYVLAGSYHFINPLFYVPFFPPYLKSYAHIFNAIAGFVEIILGILLLWNKSRSIAGYGLILMLLAFIPAHIFMIEQAPFYLGSFYVTTLTAWLRLLVVHPLLIAMILWAKKI